MYWRIRRSFGRVSALAEQRAADAPAPAGSSVTSLGMLATAQCMNPVPVGASGS